MKDKLKLNRETSRQGLEAVDEPPLEEPSDFQLVDSEEEDGGYVPTSPEEEENITTGAALVPRGKVVGKPENRKHKSKRKEVAISDIGTKSWSGQMIQREDHQVVKLLSRILTGKSKKENKGDDKKKKKKKRRRLKDGVTQSCSTSSGDEDSEDSLSARKT